MKNRGTAKATGALLLATLFWAGNFIVGATAVRAMSPVDLTWIRWIIACVPLLILAQVIEKPDWRAALRHWPRLLLLAGLGIAGYNLLLYSALQFTTPLSASLINAANPAVMAVLAAILLRERLGWRGIAGLALGLFGVLLIITDGGLATIFDTRFNTGDLLMVVAIVAFSLYTVLGRGLPIPPITATAIQGTMVAIVLTPFAIAGGFRWPTDGTVVWAVIFIAIFPSIGSYVLWNTAVKVIPPGRAGLFLNCITVFTVVISVVLGAVLSTPEVVGGIIVFAGVALSSLRPKPKADVAAAPLR